MSAEDEMVRGDKATAQITYRRTHCRACFSLLRAVEGGGWRHVGESACTVARPLVDLDRDLRPDDMCACGGTWSRHNSIAPHTLSPWCEHLGMSGIYPLCPCVEFRAV